MSEQIGEGHNYQNTISSSSEVTFHDYERVTRRDGRVTCRDGCVANHKLHTRHALYSLWRAAEKVMHVRSTASVKKR